MVQKFIKNIASENNLKVTKSVAYGVVNGYMVTVRGGYETSTITFSGAITDECGSKLSGILSSKEFIKEHNVTKYRVLRECVTAEFPNTFNTDKKMKGFVKAFPEIMRECGVIGDGFCTACGNSIEVGQESNVVLINGVAHRVHAGCRSSLNERADVEKAQHETEEKNLGKGILGAVLGALIGGIVWAVAYYMGWFFSVIGALIGFLATKGYEKLGGKICKVKMPVILIATVFGAVFGQVAGDVAYIMLEYQYSLMDSILVFFYLFQDPENAEFVSGFSADLVLGLLFAILGAVGILVKTSKENKEATLRTEVLE